VSTLLIELAGPLQSWGSRSRFATRATETAPTKSGVIGLLAAALGLERPESLARFSGLGFGVRIDQPGQVQRDFQTARTLDGSQSMPLSHRYYLSDAVFLAGVESTDAELLGAFAHALSRPVFPLFLGRRAFPPAGPIRTEISDSALEEALRTAAWRATPRHQRSVREPTVRLEIIVDAAPGERADDTLRDEPLSFDPRRREYGWRDVRHDAVLVDNPEWVDRPERTAHHDPLELLEEGA